MRKRSHLSDLKGNTFAVVEMSGGAIGASATQHRAARDFEARLVEKGDFASGTSSRSSRLRSSGLSGDGSRISSVAAFGRTADQAGWTTARSSSQPTADPRSAASVATLRAAVERQHVRTLLDLMFRHGTLGRQADMGLSVRRPFADAVADMLDRDGTAVAAGAASEAFVRDNVHPRAQANR